MKGSRDDLDLRVIEAALYFATSAMEQFPLEYTSEASTRFNVELMRVRALRRGDDMPNTAARFAPPAPVAGTLFPDDVDQHPLRGQFTPVGRVRRVLRGRDRVVRELDEVDEIDEQAEEQVTW